MADEDEIENAPLGPEDATSRDDIEESFVDVGQVAAGAGAGLSPTSTRVVVGRKGAGKTHVLLHIENSSKQRGRDVAYSFIDRDFFADGALKAYRGGMSFVEAIGFWTDIWRLAVIAAVLSRFTAKKIRREATHALQRANISIEDLKRQHGGLVFESNTPFDPVSAMYKIRGRYRSDASIKELLRQTVAADIESEIGQLLSDYGEIHFLIDGLDEFAWTSPNAWLPVQLGLFKLLFLQSSSRLYMRRTFVTISIRNYVYTHALKDTHSDRVGIGTGIVKLIWDRETAEQFLDQRLRQVSRGNFARAKLLQSERPLANWLGFDNFKPFRRKDPETVELYLLRHTRCSPREIIKIFNHLCILQNRMESRGSQLTPDQFREIISAQARETAGAMLKTAAEEILSYFPMDVPLPKSGYIRQAAEEYYISTVGDALARAIISCKKEVTTRDELVENCTRELQGFFPEIPVSDLGRKIEEVFWHSGVVAYPNSRETGVRWQYTWTANEVGYTRMHDSAKVVGFHSSMIDLCNLEASPDGPIF